MADILGPFYKGPIVISSGQSVDLLFTSFTSADIVESNIQVIGPAKLRAGSLRKDAIRLNDGTPFYRFTLDIPPLAANTSSTVVFTSGTDILTLSGMLYLTRPQSVNAGSFLGGPVTPGEILSFFGSQLGPAAAISNGGFDANGQLPVSLGGIGVLFDQTPAPLFYVSGNQINLQVPYEIAAQPYTLMTVTYNNTTVAKSTLTVGKSAPGIFAVTNADGSINGPAAPSPAGGILVVYGTGPGLTAVPATTGAPSPANATFAAQATIGGQPATVVYAGLTAGSVGLMQVNVAIPEGTPSGNSVPLQVSINGSVTQTVNIAVK